MDNLPREKDYHHQTQVHAEDQTWEQQEVLPPLVILHVADLSTTTHVKAIVDKQCCITCTQLLKHYYLNGKEYT